MISWAHAREEVDVTAEHDVTGQRGSARGRTRSGASEGGSGASTASAASTPPHDRELVHLRREALTMLLYVSMTLLGALSVADAGDSRGHVLGIVWGTTVGLALLHWVAFSLAARLADPAAHEEANRRQLLAQLSGAAVVGAVATAAVVLLPVEHELQGTRYAVAGLIAAAAFGHARERGSGRVRALVIGLLALALAAFAAGLEHALSH